MRTRVIKASFWTNEALASTPIAARLTFIGLWGMADDDGNGKANPALVKAAVFPLDDAITPTEVSSYLSILEAAGLIETYFAHSCTFFHVPSWERSQSPAYRRGQPIHPSAPEGVQAAHLIVQEGARSKGKERKGKGRERKGIELAPASRRDELFEAVAEACGIDWQTDLTDSARGSLNKAVAQLRGVVATPAEVRRRAALWPYDVPLTPPGLAKHWPALAEVQPVASASTRHTIALADRLEADGR